MSTGSGILGPDGRPVSVERVRQERSSRFNPIANWTPDVLTRQLVAYARGEIAPLSWVMEWLETHDEVIQTVAPKAKAAVSRHGYDVLMKDEVNPDQRQLAEEQQGKVQEFYQNIHVSDAVDLEQAGGTRLLFQQVMDGYGKGYAAHHVIWKPGASLSAEILKVPTWFFEVKTGRLQFLQSTWALDGVPLDTLGGRGAWMVSRGRGVMLAGTIARMFKQIPLQDWLTYCDRHGMPAFLGKTKSQKGTDGWNQMALAVGSMGAEYGAVINVDDVIDVLDLKGQGELPYEKLVDRMDRAQVMLWRGGDLSTISRGGGAVGATPQSEETDELDADNAEWVSETLNRNLTNRVIRYHFGENAPILVELKLRTKTRDNVRQDLLTVDKAKSYGVRVSRPWFTKKFGVVEAEEGEAALGETQELKTQDFKTQDAREETTALNETDDALDGLMQALRTALAQDMKPIGDALYQAYQAGDAAAVQAALKRISKDMPELAESDEFAAVLSGGLADAFLGGDQTASNQGNSDGAYKGWETRRANGWVPAPKLITPEKADAELSRGFFVTNADGQRIRFGAELKRKLDEKVVNVPDRNARKQRLRWAALAVEAGKNETSKRNGNIRTIYSKTFRKGPKHQDVEVIVDTINGYAWNIMVKGGSPNAIR
jgi:phage gp29-like protein